MRRRFPKLLARLIVSRRGATAIEYGLIVAMIAIAAIAAMRNLAGGSGSLWTNISRSAANVL